MSLCRGTWDVRQSGEIIAPQRAPETRGAKLAKGEAGDVRLGHGIARRRVDEEMAGAGD